jgi:hypothetical protein
MKSSHEYRWSTAKGERLLLSLTIPQGGTADTIRLATPYGGIAATDLLEFYDAFRDSVRVLEVTAATKHVVNEALGLVIIPSETLSQPSGSLPPKEAHDH